MSKAAELAALIGSQSAFSNVNAIINGAMQVAQRGTSSTGVGADGVTAYDNVDRWGIYIGSTSAGRVSMTQTAVTNLAGFSNSMKIQCTTTDTSIAAGEYLIFSQKIEGQNLQKFKNSSSSTKGFTLSFYARSNESRAIASEVLLTNGTNKQISKVHTIGTDWARYTMTVPAASSTQIDDDNSSELEVNFWLHAGSTYTSGTINDDALDATTNANRAAGIGSIFASTDNFIEITGVQLELGEIASSFEHKTYVEDLKDCLRYFNRYRKTNSYGEFVTIRTYSTTQGTGIHQFPTPMRAGPTLSIDTTVNTTYFAYNLNAITLTGTDGNNTSCGFHATSASSSFVSGGGAVIQSNGVQDISFNLDAEL